MGDASSSNPPPSSLLAPGFRFHPTDEELVIYYLRRKVSGRPLRVDAIAEIDLYKSEPWDLPSRSRLRSRDMEWYFFSPLDRKYANKSRTNRATAEGYWKTTGKDRPVRHGSHIVGMKKTLVFHVGRAPRGERTNWVMHEYRLEDEDLSRAGIPQDAYVVCRIFQKNGPGPQNGAQYGAPFVEEEWEGAEDLVPAREGGVEVFMDSGNQEYVQFDDFEQKQDLGNQHENTAFFAAESDGQDSGSHPGDPTNLLEEILKDQSFCDDMGAFAPGLQDGPTHDNGKNTGMGEHSHSPPDQNDGYVELKDIFDNADVYYPSSDNSVDCLLGASNYQVSGNGVDEATTFPEGDDIEFFVDTVDETADPQELIQRCPPVEGDFNLQPNDFLNPVPGDYTCGQPSEGNMVFYDAPSYDLPLREDSCVNTNELPFSPVADLSGFDMVDDLMAYFDATDNNLHYAALESSEKSEFVDSSSMPQSNSAPEVEVSSPACKATPQVPGVNIERGASSSARLAKADNQLESFNEDVTAAPDVQRNEGWNKALKKHVVNMLGSISAPPAMAEDPHAKGKSVGQISAMHSSGSIHVSAGMIQIRGLTAVGSAEHWTLQKNGDIGFLLSYGMVGNDVVSKSVCFEPITKMQGRGLSMVLRGGFSLFFLSMLILTVSFKVGMCVYNKVSWF